MKNIKIKLSGLLAILILGVMPTASFSWDEKHYNGCVAETGDVPGCWISEMCGGSYGYVHFNPNNNTNENITIVNSVIAEMKKNKVKENKVLFEKNTHYKQVCSSNELIAIIKKKEVSKKDFSHCFRKVKINQKIEKFNHALKKKLK